MSTINDGGPAFPMQEPQAIHAYAIAAVDGITDPDERDRAYIKARAEALGGLFLGEPGAAALRSQRFGCGGWGGHAKHPSASTNTARLPCAAASRRHCALVSHGYSTPPVALSALYPSRHS